MIRAVTIFRLVEIGGTYAGYIVALVSIVRVVVMTIYRRLRELCKRRKEKINKTR